RSTVEHERAGPDRRRGEIARLQRRQVFRGHDTEEVAPDLQHERVVTGLEVKDDGAVVRGCDRVDGTYKRYDGAGLELRLEDAVERLLHRGRREGGSVMELHSVAQRECEVLVAVLVRLLRCECWMRLLIGVG